MQADDILKQVAGTTKVKSEDILNRSEDKDIIRARLLAARRLYIHYGNDSDRVQSKLNCSPAHVRLANDLANRGGVDGDQFRIELRETEGLPPVQPEKPAPDPPTPTSKTTEQRPEEKTPTPEELLFRIAKERYGFERNDFLGSKYSGKYSLARHVLIYIGRRVFHFETSALAPMFGCRRDTATRFFGEATQDYGSDRNFTREVDEVCTTIGVRLENKVHAAL